MEICPGCGGRNPPELAVCPFCHRRLGTKANQRPWLRPALTALLLCAVLVSVFLFVATRPLLLR